MKDLKMKIEKMETLINQLTMERYEGREKLAAHRRDEFNRVTKAVEMISKKFSLSVMLVTCSYCNEIMGVKDGLGIVGVSSSICGKCQESLRTHYLR